MRCKPFEPNAAPRRRRQARLLLAPLPAPGRPRPGPAGRTRDVALQTPRPPATGRRRRQASQDYPLRLRDYLLASARNETARHPRPRCLQGAHWRGQSSPYPAKRPAPAPLRYGLELVEWLPTLIDGRARTFFGKLNPKNPRRTEGHSD